jgi:hypothetical protein
LGSKGTLASFPVAAGLAALVLILEDSLAIKFLFACGKDKLFA